MNYKRLIVLVGLLLIGALSAWWVAVPMLADSLLSSVRQNAASQGVVFSYRERIMSGLSLTLYDVRIDGVVRRVPLSVRIDELNITPRLLALASGSASLNVSARLYRGSVNADVDSSFDGSQLQIEATAERLEIAEHPMVRALGIERGQFSFNLPKLELIRGRPTGTFDLELVRLGKSTATELPLPNIGTITVPAFERLSARFKGGVQDRKFIVRPLDIHSDFGDIGGNLAFERLSASPPPTALPKAPQLPTGGTSDTEMNARLEVTLTASGQALIGQWLPIISNGSLSAEHTRFEIQVSGPSARPQVRMTG